MGKRRPVVVISSSSDEDGCGGSVRPATRGSSAPRLKASAPSSSASPPHSSSRSSKKPRRGCSSWKARARASGSAQSSSLKAEFDVLSEDFSECLNELGVPGPAFEGKELWVDKYKPRSLVELAVHKKKVEDVKKWLEEKLNAPKQAFGKWSLVLTGQAGVGKSATVKALAAELGADLCEWATPTPTLWAEHVHNANSEIRYISKLEEFENFVEKIRKYSLLCPTSMGSPRKPIVILIDDIPVTNGRVSFARLSKCLTGLIQSTQVPTIVSLTQFIKSDASENAIRNCEQLESLLENAGAHKVAFNPVTVNSIKKILSRICKEEKIVAAEELVHQIATASGGDIRHAMMSLQYYCLNPQKLSSASATSVSQPDLSCNRYTALVPGQEESGPSSAVPSLCGRDETLSLFHALGKFLHNKRQTTGGADAAVNPDSVALKESFTRNPLKMEVPEKVLSQAHGKARPITDFLFENVVDFIKDDGIDDACVVMSYLSEADCLLTGLNPAARWMITESYESESMAQLIAASVAVRGVLFGNSRSSLARWHTIRSPRIWQIEQSFRTTKDQMLGERFESSSTSGSRSFSDVVTEFKPIERWIGPQIVMHRSSNCLQRAVQDASSLISKLDSEGTNSEDTEEDEIEDW